MKKATKKAPQKATAPYNVTIKVLGKLFSAKGATVSEAIEKLNPGNAKGISILSVVHGDAKKDRILGAMQTYRLFSTQGVSKEIAVKNVSLMFDGI